MTKRLRLYSPNVQKYARFGEVSFDVLSDCLTNLNTKNKLNQENAPSVSGCFKGRRVVERVFHACEEFGLESLVGYQAVEILDRFMVKHIKNFLSSEQTEAYESPSCEDEGNHKDLAFQSLKGKLAVFVISSLQIASKLYFHTNVIDSTSASRYLQLLGSSCGKETLLEVELLILKTLDFKLNVPNPLMYVETLLEVLSHNDPDTPVARLYFLCRYVLKFIYLQREPVYHLLLVTATGCQSPSSEQRAKFIPVTEDFMLLGIGVISVAAFIQQTSAWEKVVQELAQITGISAKSIMDFAQATLIHITTTTNSSI